MPAPIGNEKWLVGWLFPYYIKLVDEVRSDVEKLYMECMGHIKYVESTVQKLEQEKANRCRKLNEVSTPATNSLKKVHDAIREKVSIPKCLCDELYESLSTYNMNAEDHENGSRLEELKNIQPELQKIADELKEFWQKLGENDPLPPAEEIDIDANQASDQEVKKFLEMIKIFHQSMAHPANVYENTRRRVEVIAETVSNYNGINSLHGNHGLQPTSRQGKRPRWDQESPSFSEPTLSAANLLLPPSFPHSSIVLPVRENGDSLRQITLRERKPVDYRDTDEESTGGEGVNFEEICRKYAECRNEIPENWTWGDCVKEPRDLPSCLASLKEFERKKVFMLPVKVGEVKAVVVVAMPENGCKLTIKVLNRALEEPLTMTNFDKNVSPDRSKHPKQTIISDVCDGGGRTLEEFLGILSG